VLQGHHSIAHYGPPIDVFSHAMVLYELGTGTQPYSLGDDTAFTSLASLCNFLSAGNRPTIPDHVAQQTDYINLMHRCWAADPADRPSFRQIVVQLGH